MSDELKPCVKCKQCNDTGIFVNYEDGIACEWFCNCSIGKVEEQKQEAQEGKGGCYYDE